MPPTSLAMVLAALGELPAALGELPAALGGLPAALDALEQAWRRRDTRMVYLKDDPSWRDLRDAPRYRSLLKTMRLDGLPPGLTPV